MSRLDRVPTGPFPRAETSSDRHAIVAPLCRLLSFGGEI